MPRPIVLVVLATLLAASVPLVAAADDGPPFHRTTPRGSFGRDGPALLVGVPGGRAWGVESELRPAPAAGSDLWVTVEVRDPAVREAFVRIAWYDRGTGRPRQIAIADARAIRVVGETATLEVPLDPPRGAVAYRVRVLARLTVASGVTSAGAVRATIGAPVLRSDVPDTRLLP